MKLYAVTIFYWTGNNRGASLLDIISANSSSEAKAIMLESTHKLAKKEKDKHKQKARYEDILCVEVEGSDLLLHLMSLGPQEQESILNYIGWPIKKWEKVLKEEI